jgi:hypothetical protein
MTPSTPKKTELGREMLDVFLSWVGTRRVELSADQAFCNDTIMRGQPASVVLFGVMRPDAVLTKMPEPRVERSVGRPHKRGAAVPKPQETAKDDRIPWQSLKQCIMIEVREVAARVGTARPAWRVAFAHILPCRREPLPSCADSTSLDSGRRVARAPRGRPAGGTPVVGRRDAGGPPARRRRSISEPLLDWSPSWPSTPRASSRSSPRPSS